MFIFSSSTQKIFELNHLHNSVYGTLKRLLFTVFTISSGRSEWWPDHSPPHSRHVRVSGTLPQRPGTPQPGVLHNTHVPADSEKLYGCTEIFCPLSI